MHLSIANRATLRGILAGAVLLAGASACSRSDRTETGSDTTAAVLPDTTQPMDQAAQPSGLDTAAAGYRGMERDTAMAPADTSVAPGEETSLAPSDAPVAGETDTSISDTSSIEIGDATVDTATTVETAEADTAAAGYVEMARDTSTMAEQADTLAIGEQGDTLQAEGDVALQARVDTTHAEAGIEAETDVAVEAEPADTAVVVGDSAHVAGAGERMEPVAASPEANDTLTAVAEADPARPTEDTTEVVGQVTTDEAAEEADVAREDRETVAVEPEVEAEAEVDADARTMEVGAATIAGNVTGADAVALMTRQGARCIVVDPETEQGIVLDMSDTPATLNPCGMGSMVPSVIWTEKE